MGQFSAVIGVSPSYVNNINKSIQPDKIDSITIHFPDLNTGWLLTGEGGMIKSASSVASDGFVHIPQAVFDVIQKQANSLERRDSQIDELISILKKTNIRNLENDKCEDVSGM